MIQEKKNLKQFAYFGMIQIMIYFQDYTQNLANFTHIEKLIFIQQ